MLVRSENRWLYRDVTRQTKNCSIWSAFEPVLPLWWWPAHLSRDNSGGSATPVEEDASKIRDTTRTVFIQGPSIVLLVWRSIMFNGSFLRVCRILRFVKKFDFAFLSLGGPSIVLLVWRCIMFHGSYLRACMKLRIVQKIIFSLHESGWTKALCPGLVSGPTAKA